MASTPLPDPAPDNPRRRGAGCLAGAALSAVLFVAIWLAAITVYGLVVEQWEMVRVRREFGYDWAFLYAPLIAFGVALASAFLAMRRVSAARMTLLILATGLVALFGGILLFGIGGLI